MTTNTPCPNNNFGPRPIMLDQFCAGGDSGAQVLPRRFRGEYARWRGVFVALSICMGLMVGSGASVLRKSARSSARSTAITVLNVTPLPVSRLRKELNETPAFSARVFWSVSLLRRRALMCWPKLSSSSARDACGGTMLVFMMIMMNYHYKRWI